VNQLRARLPDSQRLGDERAEQLITALAQEREAINQQAHRNDDGNTEFGVGAGTMSADDKLPSEQHYEAARQYSQRMRDRAAQYLNAEQQRQFNQLLEDTLISLRSALRSGENGSGYAAVSIIPGG
jgi:hypothetical protein